MWTVDLDGTDITSFCQLITWHPKLNRPASCSVRYPGHLHAINMSAGTPEMHLFESGNLRFSGPVWLQQPSGGPDSTYVELTAYDHLIFLTKRLCKNATGNLITPYDVITDNITGPAIMSEFVNSAIVDTDSLTPPSDPFPLVIGDVDTGGDDLSSVPTNFPMSLEQMRVYLCSTGQLNLLVNPGVGSSTIDFTNGDIVNDLTGSVSIQYQTGAYNSQEASFTEDVDDVINALWYLLGPRGPRPELAIPKDHWAGSITPTAPNAGGDGQGGVPSGVWPPALIARFLASRVNYGYMQEIRVFDDHEDEQQIRPAFEREWNNEAWIRATPKRLMNIRPQRGTVPSFGVGDLITVQAGSRLGGGFSGAQVVFEYEVQVDYDGVVDVTSIIASAEQD